MNVMTITSAWKYGRSFSSKSKCLCALTVEKCAEFNLQMQQNSD